MVDPQDLYDMFRLEGSEEEKVVLEKYLPNYKINLVDAERMNEQKQIFFGRFTSDINHAKI